MVKQVLNLFEPGVAQQDDMYQRVTINHNEVILEESIREDFVPNKTQLILYTPAQWKKISDWVNSKIVLEK